MKFVNYSSAAPFPFYDLVIRELSPQDYETLSVAEIRVPPRAAHPKAMSTSSDKIYICIEGAVTFELHGESKRLTPLDVLLIPASEWFAYLNEGSTEGRLLLVHVPPFDIANEEICGQ